MKTSYQIWQDFVVLPGASVDGKVGIASQHAIDGVMRAIRQRRPGRILELGAGIGTLTYAVLETASSLQNYKTVGFEFITIENNQFCLEQLNKNLDKFSSFYKVLPSTKEIQGNEKFDLIIVDGGGDLEGDMGIQNFDNMLAHKGIILIEGNRSFQADCIRTWYGDRDHVYLKIRAIWPRIRVMDTGVIEANKPYRLFIFEPGWFDKFVLPFWSSILNFIGKANQRLNFWKI
jgi:precorrin-6B methylase 2